jgi:hypothetical protein
MQIKNRLTSNSGIFFPPQSANVAVDSSPSNNNSPKLTITLQPINKQSQNNNCPAINNNNGPQLIMIPQFTTILHIQYNITGLITLNIIGNTGVSSM